MRAEAGFSLVELLASLTIMSVGVLAAVRVMDSAFFAASQGGNRTRAVALATKEAESMRSVPYDSLGFQPTQPGFEATFEGLQTVVVLNPAVAPEGPDLVQGGITYHVHRDVVWTSAASAVAPGTTYANAYKQVTVLLSWTDGGGTHTARQDALVYPGGQGHYVPTTTSSSTTSTTQVQACTAPGGLTATKDPTTVNNVLLVWTPPAPVPTHPVVSFRIAYSTDSFITSNTLTTTLPSAVTTYMVPSLSYSTTYQFEVAAVYADCSSANSSPATVTTGGAIGGSPTCQLGTTTVTPNAVFRRSPLSLDVTTDAVVTVATIGICANLQVTYSPSSGVNATAFMNVTTGGAYSAVLPANQNWDNGSHPLTIVDGSGHTLGTVTYTVCLHDAGACP